MCLSVTMGLLSGSCGACRKSDMAVAPTTPYRTIPVPITSRNYNADDYCGYVL